MRRYRRDLEILNDSYGTNSQPENIFDLGSSMANWQDLMGTSWLEWLFPIETYEYKKSKHTWDEKGLYFNVTPEIQDRLLSGRDLEDRLMRRVTPRPSLEANRPPVEILRVN
ncbi:Pfa3p [Saccharomyces cerevisiae x Saccharomyces kudriavzevii VIN7]|uniref:Pfa3p n=1 Tax=Saccharomyces cerevisiae x Saccharomyces kudriavzevii (strain VIN7) TaxID=1095631 RepID=H0GZT8_SACCK|nr:Pfa3p [Saccharomyces cerevisiae x Saccharomyces kudriavzevii VIN7]